MDVCACERDVVCVRESGRERHGRTAMMLHTTQSLRKGRVSTGRMVGICSGDSHDEQPGVQEVYQKSLCEVVRAAMV